MCGRFTLRTNASDLVEIFTLLRDPELTPRFNIAHTSGVAVVRQSGKTREISLIRWGFVPSWSKDPKAVRRLSTLAPSTALWSRTPEERRCRSGAHLPLNCVTAYSPGVDTGSLPATERMNS